MAAASGLRCGRRSSKAPSSCPSRWRGIYSSAGDRVALRTASGEREFDVAGIYREYGNDRGSLLMNRAVYSRFWRDDAVTGMGIYLQEGTDPEAARVAIREAIRRPSLLAMTSSAQIRTISMRIFERTFVITRVRSTG